MSVLDRDAPPPGHLPLHELTARYYSATDLCDWDAVRACFSPDFRVLRIYPSVKAYRAGEPQGVSTGLEEALYNSRHTLEALGQTHHTVGNCAAEIDGQTGVLNHHVRAYHLGTGSKAGMFQETLAIGKLHCRHGASGWLIEEIDYIACLYRGTMDLFMPDGVSAPLPESLPMLRGG